jgi:cytochrome c553
MSHRETPALERDSARMARSAALRRARSRAGRAVTLALAVLAAGCTDRMQVSDDRWGRSGQLIAMSGGEGGARYACATCHGARGEGNGFDAPRLAGLPPGYLQKQMEDFAAGLRPHAVMRDVARFLDSHERVMVARYYAAQQPAAVPSKNAELPSAATAALYDEACGSCHGPLGTGTPAAPPLNAQPAFYLAQQVQDWQASKRRNDGNHVMLKVAQQLGAEEVRQLSLYLARIPPRPAVEAR